VASYREALELTQAQLAERAGISRLTIARIETDTQEPRVGVALALAAALGVPVEELFRYSYGPEIQTARLGRRIEPDTPPEVLDARLADLGWPPDAVAWVKRRPSPQVVTILRDEEIGDHEIAADREDGSGWRAQCIKVTPLGRITAADRAKGAPTHRVEDVADGIVELARDPKSAESPVTRETLRRSYAGSRVGRYEAGRRRGPQDGAELQKPWRSWALAHGWRLGSSVWAQRDAVGVSADMLFDEAWPVAEGCLTFIGDVVAGIVE
jgi:putative transcriptional regulator